jgi:hypothetical protein
LLQQTRGEPAVLRDAVVLSASVTVEKMHV